MSILIERLDDDEGPNVRAQLRHGDCEFAALVHGDRDSLQQVVGQQFTFEVSYDAVHSWRQLDVFSDDDSCFCAGSTPSTIVIRGRVHNTIDLEDGNHLVDLYLQTGPEFVQLTSEELGGVVPNRGDALEVLVTGFCVFPNWT